MTETYTEFGIEQRYRLSIDASGLYEGSLEHRLYHALMSNKQALEKLLTYLALVVMEAETSIEYIQAHYDRPLTIAERLYSLDCFAPDDKKSIGIRLVDAKQVRSQRETMEEGEYWEALANIGDDFMALTDCFHFDASGFFVKKYEHIHKEKE